jgi:pyruvate/2-oxoglutarate dehydrogenase complex dihydrolipoamide dehydrogenase (E3) component
VESFRSGSEKRIRETEGLDLIQGSARFTGHKTISVAMNEGGPTQEMDADIVIIDTGSRPSVPPIQGIENIEYLDSTSIMELDQVPDHLVIVGGGYIGVEFGQMFRRFGSRVTMVQHGAQLLTREDPDVAGAVLQILEDEGIDILLEAEISQVFLQRGENFVAEVKKKEGGQRLEGSHLLVAAGRRPNSDGLNLDATGVQTDAGGYIAVDDRLQTHTRGIFAIGDVKGGPAFTHISYDDYRIIFQNLFRGGNRNVSDRPVPYTLFMDPQLGRVGLSEQQAVKAGRHTRVAKMPMSSVARALEIDRTRGLMKVVVDAETDRILGAAVLGEQGGEIMALLQVAMMGDLPCTELRDGVFVHPTLAESMNSLFASFE